MTNLESSILIESLGKLCAFGTSSTACLPSRISTDAGLPCDRKARVFRSTVLRWRLLDTLARVEDASEVWGSPLGLEEAQAAAKNDIENSDLMLDGRPVVPD
jgi:hypothetical protein